MRRAVVLGAVLAFAVASPAHADPPGGARFYKGYDYGSQSLQNPIYGIVNRGFDALQLRERHTLGVSLIDANNVLQNLADPFPAIRYYGSTGWGSFLETEIFPLTFNRTGARWLPNYGLHLIGGGQTFAWMREWFLAHEAPEAFATAFSAAALLGGALINESIENKGVVGYNTDAIADIFVFDIGGIVLFSFDAVRRFFSGPLILNDWSLQPSIVYPSGELHNVGNYYALKVPLGWIAAPLERLRLFAYGGVASMGGLSYKLDREYSVSVAGGGRVSSFENTGGLARVENVVHFEPGGALFVDRNESLLASVTVANIVDAAVSVNLYPNAIFHTEPGVGAWTVVGKDGKWVAGVSFTHAFGIGVGLGTR